MTLPELSIKRHVLSFMLSGVLVLFGLISYLRLGIDRFPSIEFPVISITTIQPGANPEIIDSSITNVIESKVNSTPGIDHIQSTSSPGVSVVAITFNLEKNVDAAFNEVQSKVNQILRLLPRDAEQPIVAKVETNAQPIMWLALQGDRTQQQLNQYATNVLKKRLETINGVGEVRLGGRRDRTIRINLLPQNMAAFNLAPSDIVQAFRREHVQLPGGFLVGGKTEQLLKLDLEFHSVDDMKEMVVAYRDGTSLRLKDVAVVEDDLSDYRSLARFNGKPSVGLGIVKVANTNTVAIIDEVKRRLDEEILPFLPPGMTIKIASNDALFIQQMVRALQEHLLSGTLLAALVVLFFLRNIRSTLIIAAAIPVSLLGAIAVMYFGGFTFNALTLLALLLLIGVVVDDSIVVLENIYRHRELIDPDPVSSAINGSREVFFAVLAATLALIAIFAPVIFLGGLIGKFFKSFAVVVTFGVLISFFVSLTLTPMLCSRYLRVEKQHGRLYQGLERFFSGLDRRYRSLLSFSLLHRWGVVFVTILVVLSSYFFITNLGKTFAPEEDEGRFLVFIKTPLGSSIEYSNERLREVEAVLAKHKAIATYFTAIGLGQAGQVNQGIAFVRMVPPDERSIKQSELLAILRKELSQLPGVRAFAAPVPIVAGLRGEPLQFAVRGPNLTEVAKYSAEIQKRLTGDPAIGRVDLDLQLEAPQLEMRVDRARAASLGLNSAELAESLNIMTGGINVGKFNDKAGDSERYDVRIKAVSGSFNQAADLSKIYLRNQSGTLIRLDAVASFKESLGAAVISRQDLQYAGNFFGTPTIPLGEAADKIKALAAEILPSGYTLQFTGEAEELAKTTKNIVFAFTLALILLYMVLASQFNSFLQPLIVMIAQPLAIIGGVFALWLFGKVFQIQSMTLNVYSMIGLVLLIGLVAKNSILLVDLTNQRRSEGLSVDEALKDACPIRMRPVLMTSLTIILALLPAAIGLSAGAETNGPLAVAVIGGMISSTLLTLVVVPAVYSLVENKRGGRHAKKLDGVRHA